MTWRAHIESRDLLHRHVNLYVAEQVGPTVSVIGPGGNTVRVLPNEAIDPDLEPTLRIPRAALPALLAALSAELGAVEHPQQLRKDYDAERARVDKLIDLATRPPIVMGQS